ncbi:hypothetical protein PIB30_088658, partial [Stylosanthes scabra]|nr:hypothetical protein [Stylosanthes scabra]
EGSGVKLRFLPCSGEDRVFHRGEGWEFFFMYTTVFVDIRVRFPFTEFECGVLSQLKCAPTQIHPNAWAFIRAFEILMEYLGTKPLLEMYIKVGCVEEQFPFYLDEFGLERFPLYWYSEPVQILETTIGGLKNYFKNKNERGFSAANVVKTEEEVVVNQPAEKKKEVSLEEVKGYAKKQKRLHGYIGEEDLTSIWSEHFPFSVSTEEHFQSKTDLELIDSVDDVTRAQFMQVYAARLLCLGRYEELKAREEGEQKREKAMEVQRSVEMERKFQAATEQIVAKDKELLELKSSVEQLKGKLQKLDKEKTELEVRVVELCVQKKEAETSKEDHGYDMMAAGFERARKQAQFLFPDIKFDKLDPVKVVHNGALVDNDEVDLEGGDDHNPEDGGA